MTDSGEDGEADWPQTWVRREWDELQPLFCGHATWYGGGWGKIDGPLDKGREVLFHGNDSVLDFGRLTVCRTSATLVH